MGDDIRAVTDETFQTKVLQTKELILVDFWASWCGPCKAMGSMLEDLVNDPDYVDKVKIFKLNVEENKETPKKYNIRGLPTLVLFKDGEIVGTKVGAINKLELATFIEIG